MFFEFRVRDLIYSRESSQVLTMPFSNYCHTCPQPENMAGEKELNHIDRSGKSEAFETAVFSWRVHTGFGQHLKTLFRNRGNDNENRTYTSIRAMNPASAPVLWCVPHSIF
jgi:hypothetical protein